MTVTALPTADLRPASTAGGTPPAPVETILAVLARTASHAGDPLSVTVTAPTHTIDVNVDGRDGYASWRNNLATGGSTVRGDDLGVTSECESNLHGWLMRVRIANP